MRRLVEAEGLARRKGMQIYTPAALVVLFIFKMVAEGEMRQSPTSLNQLPKPF
jgi:hypothetical protein